MLPIPGLPNMLPNFPGVDLFGKDKKNLDKSNDEMQKPQLEASLLSKQDAVNHLLFGFNKRLLAIDKHDSHIISNFFFNQKSVAMELVNGLVDQLSDDRTPNNQEEERLNNLFTTSFKRMIRRLCANDNDKNCRDLCRQVERELLAKQNFEYLEYYLAKKKQFYDLLSTIVEERDDFLSLSFFMTRNYNNLQYWDYLFKYVSKKNENDINADELTFKSLKSKSPIPEDERKLIPQPQEAPKEEKPQEVPKEEKPQDPVTTTPVATNNNEKQEPQDQKIDPIKTTVEDANKLAVDDASKSPDTPIPTEEAPKTTTEKKEEKAPKKTVKKKKKKASTAQKQSKITFKLEKDITKGKLVCLMCACFGTYNCISILLTKFAEYFKTEEDQFTLSDATKLCAYTDFELNELEKKKWILDSLNAEITAPKNKIETMEEKITQSFTASKNPKTLFEQNPPEASNDPGSLLQQLYPPKVFSLEHSECLDCGLPFDGAERVVVFPCGHGFHSNCCSLEICHLCYANQFHSLLD